jgi:AraC-like DNA-binding protein
MDIQELDIQITKILEVREDALTKAKPYIQRPPRNWNTVLLGIENSGYDIIGGEKYCVNEGDLFFFRSGILNRGEAAGEAPYRYLFVNFETADDTVFDRPPFEPVVVLSSRAVFENDFYSILSIWNNREVGYLLRCREILYRILFNMLRNMASYENLYLQHNRIIEAIKYINNHYMEDVPLKELASLCNLSVRQLSRHFQKLYNKAPHEYLMDLRFRAAVNLLRNSNNSIKEIAERSGYDSVFSFSKAFKKTLGISPQKFKNLQE